MKSEVTIDEIEKLLQKSNDIEFRVKILYEMLEKLFDKKYANDAWIFGEAPAFEYNKRTRIASVGIVDVKLNVVHGKISAAKIFGDFFGQQPVERLSDFLVGKEYRFEAI